MTYEELAKELETLFPDKFEAIGETERRELRSMDLPKGLLKLYSKHNPLEVLAIGRFRLLPFQELIDLNVWDETCEVLYQLGLSIVGASEDGKIYCLNMTETNKTEGNDVLLASRDADYAGMDFKKARASMKFQASSLEELLTKEIGFCRKVRGVTAAPAGSKSPKSKSPKPARAASKDRKPARKKRQET